MSRRRSASRMRTQPELYAPPTTPVVVPCSARRSPPGQPGGRRVWRAAEREDAAAVGRARASVTSRSVTAKRPSGVGEPGRPTATGKRVDLLAVAPQRAARALGAVDDDLPRARAAARAPSTLTQPALPLGERRVQDAEPAPAARDDREDLRARSGRCAARACAAAARRGSSRSCTRRSDTAAQPAERALGGQRRRRATGAVAVGLRPGARARACGARLRLLARRTPPPARAAASERGGARRLLRRRGAARGACARRRGRAATRTSSASVT